MLNPRIGSPHITPVERVFGNWSGQDTLLTVVIGAVGIACVVLGAMCYSDSEVKKDTKRLPISEIVLFGSFVGTFFVAM